MKIKIIEKGWETYTGPFGNVEFENAVSVGNVSEANAMALGGLVRIVEVDAKGVESGQIGCMVEDLRVKTLSAAPEHRLRTRLEVDAEKAAIKAAAGPAEPEVAAPPAPAGPSAHVFTREDLEKIADEKGIKGIRVISDPLGVKSNAIPSLIDAVLQVQKAGKAA